MDKVFVTICSRSYKLSMTYYNNYEIIYFSLARRLRTFLHQRANFFLKKFDEVINLPTNNLLWGRVGVPNLRKKKHIGSTVQGNILNRKAGVLSFRKKLRNLYYSLILRLILISAFLSRTEGHAIFWNNNHPDILIKTSRMSDFSFN